MAGSAVYGTPDSVVMHSMEHAHYTLRDCTHGNSLWRTEQERKRRPHVEEKGRLELIPKLSGPLFRRKAWLDNRDGMEMLLLTGTNLFAHRNLPTQDTSIPLRGANFDEELMATLYLLP